MEKIMRAKGEANKLDHPFTAYRMTKPSLITHLYTATATHHDQKCVLCEVKDFEGSEGVVVTWAPIENVAERIFQDGSFGHINGDGQGEQL